VKPCLVCGRLSNGSYCPLHRPSGWRTRPSPSSLDRLPPHARARVKQEAGQRCERCGRTRTPGNRLVVHHRQRVADGATHARFNLAVICQACSEREHGGKGYAR
jgi:hypothetical protein